MSPRPWHGIKPARLLLGEEVRTPRATWFSIERASMVWWGVKGAGSKLQQAVVHVWNGRERQGVGARWWNPTEHGQQAG